MPCAAVDELLAAYDGDERGVLQEYDELVAQRGEYGLEGLRYDYVAHGVYVAEGPGCARPRSGRGRGFMRPPRIISETYAPELMPRVSAPTMVVLRLVLKMTEAHYEQLHHHRRAAYHGDVDLEDGVEEAEHYIALAHALLVVRRAHGGHQDAQYDAYDEGARRYDDGCADAFDVLEPSVRSL